MTHPHVLAATAQPEYEFLIDRRDGRYFLLLVDHEMKAARRFTPFYVLVAETLPQLEALCGWLRERREQWQAWGALTRVSVSALGERLKALFECEPLPPLVTGHLLANEDGKSHVLTFAELVESPQDSGTVAVWRREFATTELAQRAKDWFMRARVIKDWDGLVALVRAEGVQALDDLIDRELAARPRRRRR